MAVAMHNKDMARASKSKNQKMSSEHKVALATGREEGRIVRNYLKALEANRPRRGRKRTPDAITRELDAVNERIQTAHALDRLHLIQRKHDLEKELQRVDRPSVLADLESEFLKVAASYSERKSISYAAWRDVGVSPAVVKNAGIPRSR